MPSVARAGAEAPLILVVDIGTSSLRAVVFDAGAREVEGYAAQREYRAHITPDGGAELDAEEMFEAFASGLDEILGRLGGGVAAVAAASLAANVLGVDTEGKPLTPVYLYSDTRDAGAVDELARQDWAPIYARTGCPLHTGYLTARLWWLRTVRPGEWERAARWISLHEFFLSKLFGRSIVSHSLASWTGLLNRERLDWDDEVLSLLGVRRGQLSPLAAAKDSLRSLHPNYRARWPALAEAPFFPAVGDGAAANLGSGCVDATRIAVTLGTSGAVRVVMEDGQTAIPPGLWSYRVDERRSLLGGSLNNGGNVVAYLRRVLQLPDAAQLERELSALDADGSGLTLLPFFAGERSPGYRGGARAALTGWGLEVAPVEILRAALEAICYRVAAIFELLCQAIPSPRAVIASGAALLNSPAWVQILADVLGRDVTVSGEQHATARGAALLALEALGAIRDASELPPAFGAAVAPVAARHEKYRAAAERQRQLYDRLLGDGQRG